MQPCGNGCRTYLQPRAWPGALACCAGLSQSQLRDTVTLTRVKMIMTVQIVFVIGSNPCAKVLLNVGDRWVTLNAMLGAPS